MTDFNIFGHKVVKITSDDEVTLATLKKHLGQFQVEVTQTPAGLHEKRIENKIRVLKDRKRAMMAFLPYEELPELECEAYMYCIGCVNRLRNKTRIQSVSTSQAQKAFPAWVLLRTIWVVL